MEKNNAIKDLENTQKVQQNSDSPKQETDNPHDKGYKRIFSIKKNLEVFSSARSRPDRAAQWRAELDGIEAF